MINVHDKTNNICFKMEKLSLNIFQTFSEKKIKGALSMHNCIIRCRLN